MSGHTPGPRATGTGGGPGSYAAHEVVDRLAIILHLLSQYVGGSVAFEDPTWAAELAEAEAIWERLHDLYQRVAGRHLEVP